MEEIEKRLAAYRAQQKRDESIRNEARLMYLVIGAVHNMIRDNDVCRIVAGSETDRVICEIVNRVEGWA